MTAQHVQGTYFSLCVAFILFLPTNRHLERLTTKARSAEAQKRPAGPLHDPTRTAMKRKRPV